MPKCLNVNNKQHHKLRKVKRKQRREISIIFPLTSIVARVVDGYAICRSSVCFDRLHISFASHFSPRVKFVDFCVFHYGFGFEMFCVSSCLRLFSREIRCFHLAHLWNALLSSFSYVVEVVYLLFYNLWVNYVIWFWIRRFRWNSPKSHKKLCKHEAWRNRCSRKLKASTARTAR